MSDAVTVRREGPVGVLTLRRGARDNAIDLPTWEALKRAALALTDAPPRALVITGEPCFSVGLDLSPDNAIVQRLEALSRGRDVYLITELVSNLRNAIVSFSRIPCPVIAAIEGPCLGVGLELALACDLRVAAEDAVLGLPDVTTGLSPMFGGLVHLRRLVGGARAADLVLTGRRLDGRAALDWGLVSRITAPGQAYEVARSLADEIARHSRAAVLQSTLALRQLAGSNEEYTVESQAASRAVSSGDLTEGMLAALQNREPRWKA